MFLSRGCALDALVFLRFDGAFFRETTDVDLVFKLDGLRAEFSKKSPLSIDALVLVSASFDMLSTQ